MAYEYLKALSLTEEQESKLRSLGARSPASLLSLLEHSPEKFAAFLGPELVASITSQLHPLVSSEEKAQMAQLPAFRGKFGALVVPRDVDSEKKSDAAQRRNGLIRQIQMLRQSDPSSSEAKAKLEDLENSLRDELKHAF